MGIYVYSHRAVPYFKIPKGFYVKMRGKNIKVSVQKYNEGSELGAAKKSQTHS